MKLPRFKRLRRVSSKPAEGVLERRALRREQFGSGFADPQIVFQAYPELAVNVDAGLVAQHHSSFQLGALVPAEHIVLNEVRPLVALHAQPVAEPMREIGEPRPES